MNTGIYLNGLMPCVVIVTETRADVLAATGADKPQIVKLTSPAGDTIIVPKDSIGEIFETV